jgi:hypothetical protein
MKVRPRDTYVAPRVPALNLSPSQYLLAQATSTLHHQVSSLREIASALASRSRHCFAPLG